MISRNMTTFNLENKSAFVTGGGGLLGAQFCESLAQFGAKVFIGDLSIESATKTSRRLNEAGFDTEPIEIDITNQAQVEDFINSLSQLDIVVNSAAIDPKVPTSITGDNRFSVDVEGFMKALEVSLLGTYLISMASIRKMSESGSGSIINLSSTYGLNGPDQRIYGCSEEFSFFKPAHYSACKAGIVGLTRYFAAMCRGTKVRVNALAPGGVENNQDSEFISEYSRRTILGRMAHQTEMNGAIVFLASDASSYMTGGVLSVDGGWTAW